MSNATPYDDIPPFLTHRVRIIESSEKQNLFQNKSDWHETLIHHFIIAYQKHTLFAIMISERNVYFHKLKAFRRFQFQNWKTGAR